MNRTTFLYLLFLNLIWSVYYIANKISIDSFSPYFVGVVVRLITLFLLTSILAFRKEFSLLFKVKRVLPRLLLIGVLGFLLDITAFLGLTYSSAANASILLKSDVLFVNAISIIYFKEKFTIRDWFFSGVTLFGVFWVLDIDWMHFRLQGIGDIFFIFSAFFIALNAFIIRGVQHHRSNPVSDHVVAYYNNFVTLLLFSICFFFMQQNVSLQTFGEKPWLFFSLAIGGSMQTLVYIFYYYNLRRLPVWIVKIILLMIPVFTSILSFWVLHDTIGWNQWIGMAIVIWGAGGIIIEQKRKSLQRRG